MEKQTVIELRGITKRFGASIVANKNVSIDVKKGEILSILGKDGRVYATNSPYFIRDFRKMVELFTQMDKPLERVAVVRSVSGKTGRDFITCSVVR